MTEIIECNCDSALDFDPSSGLMVKEEEVASLYEGCEENCRHGTAEAVTIYELRSGDGPIPVPMMVTGGLR